MNKLNYVFFDFGKSLENCSLCNMAIVSARKASPEARIIVYTDKPQYFKWASFIEVNLLTEELLKDWKGKHDFVWRVKLKVIEDAAVKYDGHILYMDGDIFVKKATAHLEKELDAGKCFMHLRESQLSESRSSLKKKMHKLFQDKTIAGIKISSEMAMWNAGIVALPESAKCELIKKTLNLNDALCEMISERWFLEQFSLSIVMNDSAQLHASDDYFTHYWGSKPEWRLKIKDFFYSAFIQNFNAQEIVEALNVDDWLQLPIYRKERSLNKTLSKIINKFLPDRLRHSAEDFKRDRAY